MTWKRYSEFGSDADDLLSSDCNQYVTTPIYASGSQGLFRIWGEWPFIFMELESTGNYFSGAGVQAHSLGDLGGPAKKLKKTYIFIGVTQLPRLRTCVIKEVTVKGGHFT